MSNEVFADSRLTTVGLMAEAWSGLRTHISAQLAEHQISEIEFEVLIRLARTPSNRLRMTDLAAQTLMSTSGITRVVDRMERDGLVSRITCASDRRGYWATLTDEGNQRISAAVVGHLEVLDTWLTGRLTGEQLASLTDALRVVRDSVRPGAVAGADEDTDLDRDHAAVVTV